MTEVTIYKNKNNECVGFRALGHSGYAQAGEDVVCAAISVLVINTLNAIETYTSGEVDVISDEEKGLIDCKVTGQPDKDTQLLLNAMILGLQMMADNKDYDQYIDLTFEEV